MAGSDPCPTWAFDRVDTAPGRKRSGSAWDADGSPPDLALELRSGTALRASEKFRDSKAASWSLAPPFVIDAGIELRLRVTDVDWAEHDVVNAVSVRVPGELEGGRFVLDGGAAVLRGHCITKDGTR